MADQDESIESIEFIRRAISEKVQWSNNTQSKDANCNPNPSGDGDQRWRPCLLVDDRLVH